ncbi:MAG: hypothetical protein ACJ77E_17985 [Gaiellaceae bacterium]
MTKFLVLYHAAESARAQMATATPEQAKAGMDAWMAWAGKAGDAVVDLGAPLGEGVVIGGGASDDAAGFSILQAPSQDAVEQLLGDHPHLHMPGGSITVHELLSPPGM